LDEEIRRSRDMPRRRITEAKWSRLVQDYLAGLSQERVATKNAVSRDSVALALKRAHVKARPRKVSVETADRVLNDYLAGDDVSGIARRYRVSVGTIRNMRIERGIVSRRRQLTVAERRQICDHYRARSAPKAIAAELGITRWTVHSVLARAGIKPRGIRKWLFDERFFKARNDTTAYWMGFLMADGCLRKNDNATHSHKLTLALDQGDLQHLQRFCRAIGIPTEAIKLRRGHGTNPRNNQRYVTQVAALSLNHTSIHNWLLPWGIVPRKTYRFVPPRIPKRLYPAFLRGWFDGDGCISRGSNGHFFRACVVGHEKRALQWYASALRCIGYNGRLVLHRQVTRSGSCWRLTISRKGDLLLLTDVLKASGSIRLARKWDQLLDLPRDRFADHQVTRRVLSQWKMEYRQGALCAEIATKYGFSPGTVHKHLKQSGVVIRGARVRRGDESLIVKMYCDGKSQYEIGRQIGKSQATVSDVLKRRGIPARPPWTRYAKK
jgi:DNA-binding CsgD family transcriptional regulator